MKIINVNTASFDEAKAKGKVLVDFYADWCGPCRMLGPILDDISQSNDDVQILKIDVDESSEIAAKYGVMSIPTMILFENGEVKDTKVGVSTKEEILDWVK